MKLLSGLTLVAAFGATVAHAATFQDGLTAYTANRVAEAETIYQAVAADSAASARDRSDAARELGRIAWLIDRDEPRAAQWLETALAAGDRPCITGALWVRIAREAKHADRGFAAEDRFLAMCPNDVEDADGVRLQAARAGLEAAAQASGAARTSALARVAADLGALGPVARAGLSANQLLLGLGLSQGDPETALAGWRGYLWLAGDHDAPQALAGWQGRVDPLFRSALKPDAAVSDQATLVELLMRTGFVDEARRLAADARLAEHAATDPAWRRAAAYFRLRDAVDAASLAENRKLARGGARNGRDYAKALKAALKAAADSLNVANAPASFADQFGLFGTDVGGETSGYPSWHAGHLVQDDRRAVDQYGRHGEIRFVVIDNMVSNGFETWLWDGRAGAGGWATGEVIVQVRPSYANGPLRAWQQVTDTPVRTRLLEQLALDEARDAEVLRSQPVAYLPGVSTRLDMQANEQILARARETAAGRGEEAVRAAFLEAYGRAVEQHSIFIHEGRHTLDRLSGERIDKNLVEYRAKLSELALADYPRLALSNIDAETIGSDTLHGKGNTLIMKAYGDWIAAHPGDVAGYDASQPAMMQIDKLTDAQIRAIARSLDPWASAQE